MWWNDIKYDEMTQHETLVHNKNQECQIILFIYLYAMHMHIAGMMDEQKRVAVTTQANVSMAAHTQCDYSTNNNELTSAWYSASRHTEPQLKFFLNLIRSSKKVALKHAVAWDGGMYFWHTIWLTGILGIFQDFLHKRLNKLQKFILSVWQYLSILNIFKFFWVVSCDSWMVKHAHVHLLCFVGTVVLWH